jgi:hypothetical protein
MKRIGNAEDCVELEATFGTTRNYQTHFWNAPNREVLLNPMEWSKLLSEKFHLTNGNLKTEIFKILI